MELRLFCQTTNELNFLYDAKLLKALYVIPAEFPWHAVNRFKNIVLISSYSKSISLEIRLHFCVPWKRYWVIISCGLVSVFLWLEISHTTRPYSTSHVTIRDDVICLVMIPLLTAHQLAHIEKNLGILWTRVMEVPDIFIWCEEQHYKTIHSILLLSG